MSSLARVRSGGILRRGRSSTRRSSTSTARIFYSERQSKRPRENENKSRSNRDLRRVASRRHVRPLVLLGTLLSRTPTGDLFVANVDQVADADYPKMKLSLRSRDYLPPGFKPLSLISPLSLASRIYFRKPICSDITHCDKLSMDNRLHIIRLSRNNFILI